MGKVSINKSLVRLSFTDFEKWITKKFPKINAKDEYKKIGGTIEKPKEEKAK